ncbi:MAG: MBOAT family protein, partial [Selenomonas sp.]|nr:MBOAT family protein [Selenomonas sp.]
TIWAAALVLSLPVVPYVQKRFAETAVTRVGEPVMATGIFLLSLVVTISSTYNPFIYFNF